MALLALGPLVAPAADPGLAALRVEQARAAMGLEQLEQARRLALEALVAARGPPGSSGGDPRSCASPPTCGLDPAEAAAYRVYLESAQKAGVVERVEAELATERTREPGAGLIWTWWRVRAGDLPLDALRAWVEPGAGPGRVALTWETLSAGQVEEARRLHRRDLEDPLAVRVELRLLSELEEGRSAKRLLRDYLGGHPERPDVLEDLWLVDPPRTLARERDRAVRRVIRGLDARLDDPLYLYRASRLLGAARADEVATAADGLTRLGFAAPPLRRPWSRGMRKAIARTLALGTDPRVSGATPSERFDVATFLAERLVEEGRTEEAASAWGALRAKEDGAPSALAHARLLAAGERWEELVQVASEAIELAARPARDDLARLDLGRQAVQLAEALALRSGAATALGDPARGVVDGWLARNLDPHPAWDAAWARAVAAHRLAGPPADEPADPLLAVALPDAEGTTGAVGDAVAVLRARAEAGDLTGAVLATQLAPRDPELLATLARMAEAAGHRDLAFATWAAARPAGAEVGDALSRTWSGLGDDPEPAAAAVVARRADALDGRAARVTSLHPPDGGDTGVAAEAPEPRPRVGRPMPAWEVAGLDGQALRSADLVGQVYVFGVWASWCGPCREELPELDAVVARLASEGLPVSGVAVSVDERVDLARRFWQRGGYVALDPAWKAGLESELRIDGLPTAYVVAADGTVVHQQLGYDETFARRVEGILRRLALGGARAPDPGGPSTSGTGEPPTGPGSGEPDR